MARNTQNIQDLYTVAKHEKTPKVAPAEMTGDINQNVLEMINDLEDALNQKQDKSDAIKKHDELLDKIAALAKPSSSAGVSEADKQRWNAAAAKTNALEDLIKEMRRELDGLNADQIRTDIININKLILTL